MMQKEKLEEVSRRQEGTQLLPSITQWIAAGGTEQDASWRYTGKTTRVNEHKLQDSEL